jgi:mannose-6-phosphate isomerase-like protein (cupin superfamily)
VSADARGGFDPFATIVHLRGDGRALPVPWTPDVFRTLLTGDGDRVIGAKHGAEPADYHADEWEMHPQGDELLYLLAGALDVVLDEPGGERRFGLRSGQACVVPAGVWHRLILRQPSDLLFVTPAHGTRHRPVGTARPDDSAHPAHADAQADAPPDAQPDAQPDE